MTIQIEVKIILDEFATDTQFDKEVSELLNKLKTEAENRIAFGMSKFNNKVEFDLVSDTIYLQSNFNKQLEQLIESKDEQTQIFLDKNLKMKYKLSSSQTEPRIGSWRNFKEYIDNI